MDKPLVSICIPTLGREDALARCLAAIEKNTTDWPYEVIVKHDDWPPNNKGCPKILAECVAESKGDFVAFIGNDCRVQPGWLSAAMECMQKWFPEMDGCVVPQDSHWFGGELAVHWICSKKLLPALGGYYFWPEYEHTCCDNELTSRLKQLNKYVFCPESKIIHDHPAGTGRSIRDEDEVYSLGYRQDRVIHDHALLVKRSQELGFPMIENIRYPRIPRKAFTFWLGDDPMPTIVKRCIASQKQYSLGWEHKVITLLDIPHGIPYVEQALAAKRWVKAVDYFKIWWLYHHGGVYFDADVELLTSIPDTFRTDSLFAGLEWNGWIGNGVIGAEAGHPILKACLDRIERDFRGDDDRNFESSVQVLTETTYGMGLEAHGVRLYEPEVFTPYDHQNKVTNVTEKTVAFHHFMVSWGYPNVHPCYDLRPRLGDLTGLRVLNIGLGSGDSGLGKQLPALPFQRLDNVEIHQPYIDRAKTRFYVAKEVTFYCGDVRRFPVEDYDLILCFDVLEHVPLEDAYALIERIRKSGARFVVFGPLENSLQNNREGLGLEDDIEPQQHVSLWTEKMFTDLGFKTEVLPGFHREHGEEWPAIWAILEPRESPEPFRLPIPSEDGR